MKWLDTLTKRFEERAEARSLKRQIQKNVKALGEMNRAERRTLLQINPTARDLRLRTHMRRPLVAVHCSHRGGS